VSDMLLPPGIGGWQRIRWCGDARQPVVCAERDQANIVSWHSYDRGGHYAAHQAPDLLVEDIRAFFGAHAAMDSASLRYKPLRRSAVGSRYFPGQP
jgi:hypothetical protein